MAKTLIKNGTIVTVNANREIIYDGAILVEDELITQIGQSKDFSKINADITISAHGQIIIPGLINAHTHTGYYMMRGLGMDRSKWEWLIDSIFPWLLSMKEKDVYFASLLGYVECIKSGTTCLVDNQNYPIYNKRNYDAAARAAQKAGLRVTFACGFSDLKFASPSDFINSPQGIEEECRRMIQNWHNKENIRVAISPISLTSCSDQAIQLTVNLADEKGVGIHTHVAESKEDCARISERFGRGFIEAFNNLGALNNKFMSVHSVYLSDPEIELLSKAHASVVHCPTANMLLCDGIAPISKMRAAGINIALGTDSPNNNNDMLELMKFACILTKVSTLDPLAITAADVLEMATINGARALHLDDQIGSLEEGKRADITIVNARCPRNTPLHDPVAALVYSANGADVTNVMVNGKFLLKDGQVTFLDEMALVDDVQQRADTLAKHMKVH